MAQQSQHPLRLRAPARQFVLFWCRKWSSVIVCEEAGLRLRLLSVLMEKVSSERLVDPCWAALR